MARLFESFSLASLSIRNRIMVSPMCQYSCEDGFATDWHLVHLGSRAVGGAGIVCTEGTAVSPEGRISYADLGIWKDEHIPGLRRITSFVEEQGAVPAIQLAHAGRKAGKKKTWEGTEQLELEKGGWLPVSPSPIPFNANDRVPKELSESDIAHILLDFEKAAKRALEAGFKIIELHAAHGYLLHSFYSPVTNHRADAYGGSFENRCRLLLEVVAAVKKQWPEKYPLFVRLSSTDWLPEEPSWSIEDSVELSRKLKSAGVNLVDASSGGIAPHQKIIGGAGYQAEFAARIKREAKIATGAVGLITTAAQAEHVVRSGQADLVIMAREMLRNPYFPLAAASELNASIDWPKQYERAKK